MGNYRYFTWAEFDAAVSTLVDKLTPLNPKENGFVIWAEPRGGYALGLALSHALGIPMLTVEDIWTPSDRNKYAKIIFVDDVLETGRALSQFADLWTPRHQLVAAIWVNKTQFEQVTHPGHYKEKPFAIQILSALSIEKTTWAVFPWENQQRAAEDKGAYYKMTEINIFPVNNIYPCIQGEGVNTGVPMILLRLQGCDVGCPWCDTKETWEIDPNKTEARLADALGTNERFFLALPEEIAEYVNGIAGPKLKWVMLTGGEPSTYALKPLVDALHDKGFKVALETSGTRLGFVGAGLDWVCVSPKIKMPGGRPFLQETLTHADEIKMVIGKPADVLTLKSLLNLVKLKDGVQICLQPVSQSEKATSLCIKTAQAEGWRVSIQVHKMIQQP